MARRCSPPDLRQLRYVVEVARQRSFTKAAARLHIAQQALSQQVRVVEDGLGVALFERTNRGAEPTAAGLVFVQEAKRAIAAAERVVSRTRAAANLALEIAPIRVNVIAAGFVDTPLSATLLGDQLEARREELRETLPIRRVVGPADIAALAVHLMSNTAVTGATYDIDGGQQVV
jgi:DNA-binding transcriptional LysR family regulator